MTVRFDCNMDMLPTNLRNTLVLIRFASVLFLEANQVFFSTGRIRHRAHMDAPAEEDERHWTPGELLKRLVLDPKEDDRPFDACSHVHIRVWGAAYIRTCSA